MSDTLSIILTDLNGEPAFKKRNVPNNYIDCRNKENIDDVNNVNSKPVIAGESCTRTVRIVEWSQLAPRELQ